MHGFRSEPVRVRLFAAHSDRPPGPMNPAFSMEVGNSLLGIGAFDGYPHGDGDPVEGVPRGFGRLRPVGAAMNRFGYLRDPLFALAVAGYVLNRFWLRYHFHSRFLSGYFDDVLLIPAALPVVLWLQRITTLREHDRNPTWGEMSLHLVIWSVICEWLGPRWLHHGFADPWDVLAYAVGGIGACLWWHRRAANPLFNPV